MQEQTTNYNRVAISNTSEYGITTEDILLMSTDSRGRVKTSELGYPVAGILDSGKIILIDPLLEYRIILNSIDGVCLVLKSSTSNKGKIYLALYTDINNPTRRYELYPGNIEYIYTRYFEQIYIKSEYANDYVTYLAVSSSLIPPSPITNLSAIYNPVSNQVSLSWNFGSLFGQTVIETYIYRSLTSGNEELYDSILGSGTTYTDISVNPETWYFYKIKYKVLNDGLISEFSNEASVQTLIPDPSPPSNLIAVYDNVLNVINISWTLPTLGLGLYYGQKITELTIDRSFNGGSYERIGTYTGTILLPVTQTTHVDDGTEPAGWTKIIVGNYTYRIQITTTTSW